MTKLSSIFRNRFIYLLNFSLLITHQIESAYWQEWELFGIPGGVQIFMILNLLLILMGMAGLLLLWERKHEGLYFSVAMAITGIAAFAIHLTFLLMGSQEFTLPLSIGLLVAILLVSLVQAWVAIRTLMPRRRRRKKVFSPDDGEVIDIMSRDESSDSQAVS